MIRIKKNLFITAVLLLVMIMAAMIIIHRGNSFRVTTYRSGPGWGYDIVRANQVYIHQPFIPAIEGQVPFKDRKSARKTGKLVLEKIRNHKSPAVKREELKSVTGN